MQDYLRAAAERRPDATAITLGPQTATFADVEESSSRLARLLLDLGCRRGDRVCLLVPKSPLAVVAMHAALKADCWYVPLDLESPPARVRGMISAAEPTAIIATDAAVGLLDAIGPACPVVSLGGPLPGSRAALADAAAYPAQAPPARNRPDDPSHILFTSGSTGVPKGVMVRHSSVIAFVEWARSAFGLADDDRVSGHSPFHFDLSTFDIYGALAAGAELHLVPPEANLLPSSLASFIARHGLTQWFSVPSAMTLMAKLDVVEAGAFPDLRRVLWCGEVLPTPTLIHWMQRVPHATFTNLYGPTEATIASSYYNVGSVPRSATDAIPIGHPCAGEELRVLDDRMQPAPPGALGHLYIGGVGLSPGYWRDEEKTRAAFVEVPADGRTTRLYRTGDLARVSDGLVYFEGREDTQIKSRGHRIELGEIEAALGGLDLLSEYAVVGVDSDGFEGTAICCAFVPRSSVAAEPAVLKRELRCFVPAYMLPSRWQRLDALPKNANGKVDRPKLRELFREAARG